MEALRNLELQTEALLQRYELVKKDNMSLRSRQAQLLREQEQFKQKLKLAKTKLKETLDKLKTLENM